MHINIDAGRHLELYLEKARARGETLAFSLNCGVGPGLHFAAATPAEAAPADTDELGIASVFHEAPLELVEGKKLPVHVVSNAMYALECEIVPGELGEEGPFAEVTGYYARREPRPVVHVRAMHVRPDPGVPDHPLRRRGLELGRPARRGQRPRHAAAPGAGRARRLLQPRRMRLLPRHRLHPPNARRLVEAGGASPPSPRSRRSRWSPWSTTTSTSATPRTWSGPWPPASTPTHGIVRIDNVFGHGLNPGFPDYLGTKVGFDACRPFPHTPEYDRAAYDKADLAGHDIDVPEIRSGAASAG